METVLELEREEIVPAVELLIRLLLDVDLDDENREKEFSLLLDDEDTFAGGVIVLKVVEGPGIGVSLPATLDELDAELLLDTALLLDVELLLDVVFRVLIDGNTDGRPGALAVGKVESIEDVTELIGGDAEPGGPGDGGGTGQGDAFADEIGTSGLLGRLLNEIVESFGDVAELLDPGKGVVNEEGRFGAGNPELAALEGVGNEKGEPVTEVDDVKARVTERPEVARTLVLGIGEEGEGTAGLPTLVGRFRGGGGAPML